MDMPYVCSAVDVEGRADPDERDPRAVAHEYRLALDGSYFAHPTVTRKRAVSSPAVECIVHNGSRYVWNRTNVSEEPPVSDLRVALDGLALDRSLAERQ